MRTSTYWGRDLLCPANDNVIRLEIRSSPAVVAAGAIVIAASVTTGAVVAATARSTIAAVGFSRRAHHLIALVAVHRAVRARHERDRCGATAVCANRFVVFSVARLGRRALSIAASRAAIGAAAGGIGESAAGKEFLLASGEGEFATAITACEDTIFVHVVLFPFPEYSFRLTMFFMMTRVDEVYARTGKAL